MEHDTVTTDGTDAEDVENGSSNWWGIAPFIFGAIVFMLYSNGALDGVTGKISSAASLEKSISSSAAYSFTGSKMNVQDVACAATHRPSWYLCSWRSQGSSDTSIYRVEVDGSSWQSGAPIGPGNVAHLSHEAIDAMVW